MSASRPIAAAFAMCALLFSAVAMSATDPESYAVVALIGDEISVVTYHRALGSSLDSNQQQHIPNVDDRFDRLATQVSMAAIRTAMPSATIEGLSIEDPAFAHSETSLPAGDALPALLDAVSTRLKQKDTHYLLLISKYRAEARLKVRNGTIGSGRLYGLGFYIDSGKRMIQTDTSESGRGFVAPFAYVTASLIDLHTGTVVRSESVSDSVTRANTGPSTSLNPWDAMTADQKIRALDFVVRRALQWAVPRVVAPI